MEEFIVNSDKTKYALFAELEKMYAEDKYLKVKVSTGKQRSLPQNKALHLYCTFLSEALNNAGLDMVKTLKPGFEIPWTPEAIKKHMWKPLQKAMIGVESTAKAKRDEYPKIYEVLNRHTASKLGVAIRWPTKENQGL